MECNTCKQLYVGYTTTTLPKRCSNHESHIKRGIRSCKFLDIDHGLDFNTPASFNSSLSACLSMIKVKLIK